MQLTIAGICAIVNQAMAQTVYLLYHEPEGEDLSAHMDLPAIKWTRLCNNANHKDINYSVADVVY